MKIRHALPRDMVAVVELSRELAKHVNDPDPGSDASQLMDSGFGRDQWFECLVAEEEDRIVGFASFCRRFEFHTREKRLWLSDLWVTHDQRRKGIGGALIIAVRARATELGCVAIDFEVAHGNDTARDFYKNQKAEIYAGVEPWRLAI